MRESQHLPMKKTLTLHMSLINAATTTCLPDSFKIYIHHSFVPPLGFASLSVGTLNQSPVSESQQICFRFFLVFFSFDSNCYSPHSSLHFFGIISPTLFE
ncbi:hypothetical protein Hanom_Chr00s000233g01629991 [Helianthus anomalus]